MAPAVNIKSFDTYIFSMRGEDDTRGMVAFESLQGLKWQKARCAQRQPLAAGLRKGRPEDSTFVWEIE